MSGPHAIARSLAAVLVAAGAIAALLYARSALVPEPLERLREAPGQDGRTVREGSWLFPRGGPYVLGFDSPGGAATLTIDGTAVVSGTGMQSARVVHEPGIKAARFEAPAGARLLWHPPGRRGPLEYVPQRSLAPEPPGSAHFDRWAGASPLDGAIAAGMVAVLLALGMYLARGAIARADRRVLAWAAVIATVALAVRVHDLGAAGQTWDEDVNWAAGRNYVTNVLALDASPPSWEWNYEHPPVMKYIAGIGAQFADGYGPARGLSALLVALACALLVPIGARLYTLRVGALAAVLAALTPHLIAHGKLVGHEAPTLLLWALGIWLALGVHDPKPGAHGRILGLPHAVVTRLVILGLVVGLAVFSRFVNGLLGVLVLIIVAAHAPAGTRLRTVLVAGVVLAVMTVAVGFAVWPRLWTDPIEHMREAWIKLRKPHAGEPFLGTVTNQPPRHYFLVYLGATAPLGVAAAAGIWLARAAVRRRAEARALAVLVAWLAVPMVVTLSPVRQDGVRYIMPCLLALSVVAAAGLDTLALVVTRHDLRPRPARITAVLGAAMVVYLAVTAARIHPYYLDYYGEHAGGPAGVARTRRFEIAWWGEGLDRAIEYVNRHAEPRARVHKSCVEPSHLIWLRADLWDTEAKRVTDADWIVVYQPSWKRCMVPRDARLVFEVSAQGAPLARVYQRSP